MTNNTRDTKDLVNLVVPLRLACLTNSGWPMIVSLWFKFLNDRFYCATQENAKIISYLKIIDVLLKSHQKFHHIEELEAKEKL